MSDARYYHGGPAGIPLLGWIEPASVTGRLSVSDVGPDGLRAEAQRVHRRDRVYVTTDPSAAALFAAGHPHGGAIYEVAPVGELLPDPDCSRAGLSWSCVRARVLRSRKLTASEARALLAVLVDGEP